MVLQLRLMELVPQLSVVDAVVAVVVPAPLLQLRRAAATASLARERLSTREAAH
jgi:hypothetical protein